jgi:S-adenosylmethionine hydrolase
LPLVAPEGDGIRGEVWWLDQFGNCQTNVSPEDLHGLGAAPGTELTVQVGATEYDLPWVVAYGDVEPGEPLLHVDSYGLAAIAVREGSAAERLNLTEGHQVVFRTAG